MKKNKFLEEIDVREFPLHCDEDYALSVFNSKVEPYLHLISKFRNEGLSKEKIRIALGVGKMLWKRFEAMPSMEDYIDSERDYMSMKSQMDIVRAVNLKPDNAVAVKLQAERFDPFYIEEGKGLNEGNANIRFEIVDGKESDEEIEKRVDIDIKENVGK